MTGVVVARLDTAAVADFYRRAIAPQVDAIETARIAAANSFWWRAGLAVFINSALIAFFITDWFGPWARQLPLYTADQGSAVQLVMLSVVGCVTFAAYPLSRFKNETKAALLARIVGIFPGFVYNAEERMPPALLVKSGLFADYDRDAGGDLIKGDYNGVAVTSANVALIKEEADSKSRKQQRNVFKGPVYHLSFPRRFQGVTRVRSDGGWLGNRLAGMFSGLERVSLEDPVFEKTFEVFSTDQIEARYILTTGFMELLLKVAARHGNKLEAAFFDQSILLKVAGHTARLQVKSPLGKVDWQAEVTRLIEEFQDAFAIAEELKLNQKIGL